MTQLNLWQEQYLNIFLFGLFQIKLSLFLLINRVFFLLLFNFYVALLLCSLLWPLQFLSFLTSQHFLFILLSLNYFLFFLSFLLFFLVWFILNKNECLFIPSPVNSYLVYISFCAILMVVFCFCLFENNRLFIFQFYLKNIIVTLFAKIVSEWLILLRMQATMEYSLIWPKTSRLIQKQYYCTFYTLKQSNYSHVRTLQHVIYVFY